MVVLLLPNTRRFRSRTKIWGYKRCIIECFNRNYDVWCINPSSSRLNSNLLASECWSLLLGFGFSFYICRCRLKYDELFHNQKNWSFPSDRKFLFCSRVGPIARVGTCIFLMQGSRSWDPARKLQETGTWIIFLNRPHKQEPATRIRVQGRGLRVLEDRGEGWENRGITHLLKEGEMKDLNTSKTLERAHYTHRPHFTLC